MRSAGALRFASSVAFACAAACGGSASPATPPPVTGGTDDAVVEPAPLAAPVPGEAYGPDAPVELADASWPLGPLGFYDVEAPFVPPADAPRSYPRTAAVLGAPGPRWERAPDALATALVRLARAALRGSDLGPPTNCHLRVGVWPTPDLDGDGRGDRLVRADWVVPAADGEPTDEVVACGAIDVRSLVARALPEDAAADEAWAGEVVFAATAGPSPRFLGLVQHVRYDATAAGTGLRVDDVVRLEDGRVGLAGRLVDFCEDDGRHLEGRWVGAFGPRGLDVLETTLGDDPCG